MQGNREFWNSRTAFILAAVGSAIGLGNIWRFPYVCYANGGGTFLIAYLLCLLVAGIPLLMLEFSLGYSKQKGAPGAFREISPKLEWFGWFAVGIGFVIVVYYAVIMGYCANYTFYSLTLAWGNDTGSFFFNDFLGITDPGNPAMKWSIGGFQWPLLIGFVISWILVIASVWKGTKTIGKVSYFTVIIPWIILIIFTIRGITLPGAKIGLLYYLTPVWSNLQNPQLWLAAITQAFFSLTVGFGVMIAYGSFLPKNSDIVQNSFIIGIADALTAFIGGLAVFGALGHKAHIDNVGIEAVARGGPGLAFVTYPEIISSLPFARLFGVLFFLMLLGLAVCSAFSLLQAVSSSFRDKFGWSFLRSNLTVGITAFVLGLPLLTGAGLHWLDITDNFMNQFGLALVVLGQCLILTFVYGLPKLREFLDKVSVWKTSKFGIITFCIAVVLIVFSILSVNEVRTHLIAIATSATVIVQIVTMLIYYNNPKVRAYFHEKLWYIFSYFWDICVLFMTPMGIVLMLIFEITARVKAPYGDFADRGLEFTFGWLVLILVLVGSVVFSLIRWREQKLQK